MKFAFLALAIAMFVLPLVFHVDKKIFNNGIFKTAIGASLVTAVVFSIIGVCLTLLEVVNYGNDSVLGIFFKELPLEQYLLNFTFSFATIGLYQYLNIKFPKNDLQKYSLALSNLLLGLCMAFLFLGYARWYILLTFATLLLLLFFIEYIGKLRFMYRAYRAFVFMLVPFYITYGILFGIAAITVNAQELAGFYIVKIPLENHFILLSVVLLSVYMFEFFKNRKAV